MFAIEAASGRLEIDRKFKCPAYTVDGPCRVMSIWPTVYCPWHQVNEHRDTLGRFLPAPRIVK